MQGFKAVEQKAVPVSLGQTTSISLKLDVGGITETVSVVGTSTIVNTSSTTTGAVLSSEMLQTIPVGRRFTDTLYLAPGVSSGGSVGRANPSVSGGSGLDNLYVVDGVNVTNTGYGAVGSYSIIFGSLGTRHALRLHQGSPGQDRRLRGRVRPVDGRRRQRRDQERQQLAARLGLRLQRRPHGMEAAWKTFQSANGTVNTLGTGRSDVGVEAGFPIIRNRLFFFGAINPAWEKRTFIAPDGFPLRSLGEVDRERQSLAYSGKATWQVASAHRLDVSVFGDPAKGDMGPQRTSSLLVTDTSSFSELEYGGHNQTLRYDGVLSPNLLLEANFSNAFNKISETPVGRHLARHRHHRRAQHHHRRHRRLREGQREQELPVHRQGHLGRGRPPGQGRRPVRGRRVRADQPAHRPDVHRARRHADRDRRRRSASSPTRPSAGSTA